MTKFAIVGNQMQIGMKSNLKQTSQRLDLLMDRTRVSTA